MAESYLVSVQEREKTAGSESEKLFRPAQNCDKANFELLAQLIAKRDQWTFFVFVGGLGVRCRRTKWLGFLVACLFIPAVGIWQASYGQQAQLPAAVNSPPAPIAEMGSASSTHERLEQAQAEYYKAQIEKIKEDSWLKDYGVLLGTLAAALIAAIAALVTLRVNLRATLKGQADSQHNQMEVLNAMLRGQEDARFNQQDTQFYEALKRLGEKDSPMVRAGAVALLSDISLQNRNREHFLNLALNIILEALVEEENDTVIQALVRALERFSEVVPHDVVEKLIPLNTKLQTPFVTAAFEVRCYPIEDDEEGKIGNFLWTQKAVVRACLNLKLNYVDESDRCAVWSLLNIVNSVMQNVMDVTPEGKVVVNTTWREYVEQRREVIKETAPDLAVDDAHLAGMRLWATAAALRGVLSSKELQLSDEISMSGLFLPRAFLRNRDFRGKSLSGAVLSGSDLEGAHFEKADLTGAKLHGAILKGANLTGAKLDHASLFQARIDGADLTKCTWWRANFFGFGSDAVPCLDENLVQELYEFMGEWCAARSHPRGDVRIRSKPHRKVQAGKAIWEKRRRHPAQ